MENLLRKGQNTDCEKVLSLVKEVLEDSLVQATLELAARCDVAMKRYL